MQRLYDVLREAGVPHRQALDAAKELLPPLPALERVERELRRTTWLAGVNLILMAIVFVLVVLRGHRL